MISDTELIEVIDNSESQWGRPFVTATQVAEWADMSRQGIHRRLEKLHQSGEIRKYKPGRDAIWWTETQNTEPELSTQ